MNDRDRSEVGTDGRTEAIEWTEADVASALTRFGDRVTRVEAHFNSETASTRGDHVRCLLQASPSGMDRVSVTHYAASIPEALRGATDQLVTLLSRKLEPGDGQRAP